MDPESRHRAQLLHDPPKDPPRVACRGELLFEFLRGHTRIRCELRDHGDYGIEAQILHDEELVIGRTFHRRLDPTRTPREMAIAWAEAQRADVESRRDDARE